MTTTSTPRLVVFFPFLFLFPFFSYDECCINHIYKNVVAKDDIDDKGGKEAMMDDDTLANWLGGRAGVVLGNDDGDVSFFGRPFVCLDLTGP